MRKVKRREDHLRDQLVRWGKETMLKTPHCPKGMQFVNTDFLIDAHDLGKFEDKLKTYLEDEQDRRQTDLQARMAVDLEEQGKK